MGFGKLFTKEGKNESRRSSTLSKISNWSHKQSNKRNSQPSPAVSFTSLQPSKSISHNPFETCPVTPSESVQNVHAARTSTSSFDHSMFDHVLSPTSYATFDEKLELGPHDSPTPMEGDTNSSPSDPFFEKDQNLHNELLAVSLQLDTINPKNAIEIKQKLNNVNTLLTNALDSSNQLQSKLSTVIASSKQTIVSVTEEKTELEKKQHDVLMENIALKEQCKCILDQKLSLVEDKSELQQQLNAATVGQSELKVQVDALEKHKRGLEEVKRTLQEEVDRLGRDKGKLEQDSVHNDGVLKAQMAESEREMTTRLEDKEGEINALKKELNEMNEKYQQLIMKSENDERQYQSEIKSSGEVANQLQEQHNAVLAQEKIKLADCTSQIRDLMRNKDKSNRDTNKIVQENAQLKDLLEILKEENIGLKEQTEQSQQDIADLTTASAKAASAVMDKEEKDEEKNKRRINALEKENTRLQKLLESMEKPAAMNQDDVMRTHTKAQLVLIEYLEGQDDVIQAMAKFKKQLEE